jgi:hypothetical protein
MPRQPRPPVGPAPAPPCTAAPGLTDEQVCRWAELIAGGDLFPADLPPPDRDRLLAEVRRRRRDRLVRHIARAIARDLRGQPE